MKNTILIILFLLLFACGAWYVYQQFGDKLGLTGATDSFKKADDEVFAAMKAEFQKADASNTYDWLSKYIGEDFAANSPKGLVNGKMSKAKLFLSHYYSGFYYYAQGGPQTLDGGAQYQVGGGYDRDTLGAAIMHLYSIFEQRINGIA